MKEHGVKIRPGVIFLILLMALMAAMIISSLSMKSVYAKLLPIILCSAIFILSAVILPRELTGKKGKKEKLSEAEALEAHAAEVVAAEAGEPENKAPEKKQSSVRTYLEFWAWPVGFLLGIYLIGLVASSGIFVLAYMKSHQTRWITSVLCAVITSLVIWGIFQVVLKVELYPGILFGGLEI